MNNKPTVVVPKDPKKREEMIFALEYQLAHDENPKDREIHKAALKTKSRHRKSPPKRWAFLFPRRRRRAHLYTTSWYVGLTRCRVFLGTLSYGFFLKTQLRRIC